MSQERVPLGDLFDKAIESETDADIEGLIRTVKGLWLRSEIGAAYSILHAFWLGIRTNSQTSELTKSAKRIQDKIQPIKILLAESFPK